MIEQRNEQAHETKGQFAQLLLCDQFKDKNIFHMWKDIFPVVYGATVEELAARETVVDEMIFKLELNEQS